MQTMSEVSTVVQVIQMAIAPAFLLSGTGAILAVLINRLARVIDRFRILEGCLSKLQGEAVRTTKSEMLVLHRRTRLILAAISSCTVCALLICVVIVTLFVGAMTGANVSHLIPFIFIAAMLSLILGLIIFLREILLAASRLYMFVRSDVVGKEGETLKKSNQ